QTGNVRAQRHPEFMRLRKRISFGHHTDDGREVCADLHIAADRARVAVESLPPYVIAEQHDGVSARTLVSLRERAAEKRRARRNAEHLNRYSAEPDSERHRESANDCKSRIFHEHPESELQVERHSAQPRSAPPLAKRFAMLLHSTEGDERAPPRFDTVKFL